MYPKVFLLICIIFMCFYRVKQGLIQVGKGSRQHRIGRVGTTMSQPPLLESYINSSTLSAAQRDALLLTEAKEE